MIDRVQRDELARALQLFLEGRVDLEGFWRLPPVGWMRDRAVAEIVDAMDDWSSERRWTGTTVEAMDSRAREAVRRSVLFLHGDLEYRWRFVHDVAWLRWLTRTEPGDADVWPFFRRRELEAARGGAGGPAGGRSANR